jgi:predicted MFS family arabinose efflux permease
MNRRAIFIFLNFYLFLFYSAYGAPTLLFPSLAKNLGIDYILIGVCFSAYPVAGFFGSFAIGKIMSNYDKKNLLLIFNTIGSLTRIGFGLLIFVENLTNFFLLALFTRMISGFAEGSITPIIFSLVPEYFPIYEEMMMEIGILEISGLVGAALGAPITSLLSGEIGFFPAFALSGLVNLILGSIVINYSVKRKISSQQIIIQKNSIETLDIKKTLFTNSGVLLNFFLNSLFMAPNFLVNVGYQIYAKTLTDNDFVISFILSLLWIGGILGVGVFKLFYRIENENRLLFIIGLFELLALPLFGPDPLFQIQDNVSKLVLMSIGFLITGICMEINFMIVTKKLLVEIMKIFPDKKPQCIDFANGMYTASFRFSEFAAPLLGSLFLNSVGYSRSLTFYDLFLIFFFLIYWINRRGTEEDYNLMINEKIQEVDDMKNCSEKELNS